MRCLEFPSRKCSCLRICWHRNKNERDFRSPNIIVAPPSKVKIEPLVCSMSPKKFKHRTPHEEKSTVARFHLKNETELARPVPVAIVVQIFLEERGGERETVGGWWQRTLTSLNWRGRDNTKIK